MKQKLQFIFFVVLLANSIYLKFWPLAFFIFLLISLQLYIDLFPNSHWLEYLSFSFGPIPRSGEKQSQYLFRFSLFMFSAFLVLITFMLTLSYLSSNVYPSFKTNGFIMGISFALTLLAGMGFLGSVICLIKGLWLKLRGKEQYYLGKGYPTLRWRESMRNGDNIFTNKSIKASEAALNDFLSELNRIHGVPTHEQVLGAIKNVVLKFNKLNKKYDDYIDTMEREELCEFFDKAIADTGFQLPEKDLTEEWREW